MKKILAFAPFYFFSFLIAGAQNCNNWLGLPSQPSFVNIGDLNVPGNQITVEAEINRTTPYVGGSLYAGDIVAKHSGPPDINYLLRPNSAEITTADGVYHITPPICAIELNKTYHVAMVYDGVTLKFYRNGFLMSQASVSGNLWQNNWPTQIGYYSSEMYNENFIGYINEVRIWNVARTQAQIQAYMNTSLPSPATQTGLLAYYTFDNLLNKQGNAAWNGTLGGSAAINQTNPTCAAFVADNDCCPPLTGSFSGNTICAGDQGLLTFHLVSTPANPPYVITYSDGTNTYIRQNVQDNIPFPVAIQPIANSNYTLLSIKDAGSCDATAVTGETATIIVNPDPVLQISNDTSICFGTSLQLLVSGANTYQWTPAAYLNNSAVSNPLATPSGQTRFYVTGTDLLECQGKDSVLVSILPKVVFNAPSDTSVCAGGAVQLNSNNDPKYKYQWLPADYLNDPSSSGPVSTPVQTIQYALEITDPVCQADTSFTLQVTVNQSPVVKASKSNDIDCTTGVSHLDASGAQYYEWTPAAGINNPQIANPETTIDTTTTFTVTGTDLNSCMATDTVTVLVTSKGKALFEVPNAFTPNYDGINDCFGITKWGNVTIKEFSIYNRWGQKVFDTRNPSECWNGTFHGEMQDTGGYVYVIKAVSFCGNITRTGTVMLIR